ncbi:MAG: ACP S-malonyltransferase [Bifidobacteriaceae bacterium]|jgi:[acyl-carrier-protein] S-malonyltransferase|nr:ACP S-malonyltransferase [Bifidobacteriaceae bacterium]
MRALVAPGQGAQKPGMLRPWLPEAAPLLERWSEITQVDLIAAGTVWPAEAVRATEHAQPLLTAAALLSYQAVDQPFDLVAGHSVGEFAAAAIAGVISADDAMRAVAARGRAMAACAEAGAPSGLAAVVGGSPDAVVAAISAAGAAVANCNGPGQIVAGGTLAALDRLAAAPPPRTRVVRLDVAGAFHTALMAPAEHVLRSTMRDMAIADAAVPLVSNRDGLALTSGRLIAEAIIGQVAKPVRWDLVLERFQAHGIVHHLELAPAGVLTGLARRGLADAVLEQAPSAAESLSP